MNNNYHRDNEGNWFIRTKKGNIRLAFSDSMEIAYKMGGIAALDQIRRGMNETTLPARFSQVSEEMDNSPLQR